MGKNQIKPTNSKFKIIVFGKTPDLLCSTLKVKSISFATVDKRIVWGLLHCSTCENPEF